MQKKKFISICSQCRRAGTKLFIKGDKCMGPKCTLVKRNSPPGQHGVGSRRGKISGYGKQLREKQQAKQIYGLRERQFANYVAAASKKTGDTSKLLLSALESRLDNVIFRTGLVGSRAAARQFVGHGFVKINGKKIDIASYQVRVGDEITINDIKRAKKNLSEAAAKLAKIEAPAWLAVDAKNVSAKVLNTPSVAIVPFNSKAIIEFYSR